MKKDTSDMRPCHCCAQMRPFPTHEGVWEYLEHPHLNPDGSLVTEHTSIDYETKYVEGCPQETKEIRRVIKVEQIWQKVNIIDVRNLNNNDNDNDNLLVVPFGKRRAIWWPNNSIWRKIGDKPTIDWKDVISEDVVLGTGERDYKTENEDYDEDEDEDETGD